MSQAKKLRQSRDLYTIEDLAKELGLTHSATNYQIRAGRFPAPTRGDEKRKYYSSADIAEIKQKLAL